jgi:hypothetical protein
MPPYLVSLPTDQDGQKVHGADTRPELVEKVDGRVLVALAECNLRNCVWELGCAEGHTCQSKKSLRRWTPLVRTRMSMGGEGGR